MLKRLIAPRDTNIATTIHTGSLAEEEGARSVFWIDVLDLEPRMAVLATESTKRSTCENTGNTTRN